MIKRTNLLILTICLNIFCISNLQANICVNLDLPSSEHYEFNDDISVTTYDGTEIAANLFVPKTAAPAAGWPSIIFVNSWAIEEHEYIAQAIKLAKKGYQVLSYSARGWGCSTGVVDTLGANDVADVKQVVDYLQNSTNADMNNIAISGISYGGGMSLRGLAADSRIKTAVAMSTPTTLTEALYGNESVRLFWGGFLVLSGYLTANMDPIIAEHYANLLINHNVDEALDWARQRSPSSTIELINARQAPVYIANSFGDGLFQPNGILDFYKNLTGPKRLDLNQGTHASAEGLGLIGLDNYSWNNAHDWFDYWLKGENTGIMQRPPVTMLTEIKNERHEYADWPIPQGQEKTFYMKPRGLFSNGKLSNSRYNSWWSNTNTITSGIDSGASTGIPAVSELLSGGLSIPVTKYIPFINRVNGLVYQSDSFSQDMKIRGIPKVKVQVTPTYKKMQLVAYLYDVDRYGNGTLITHAPVTLHDANAWQRTQVEFDLVAAAYDVKAGHKIALAFDTSDLLYSPPTILLYSVNFNHASNIISSLTIPFVD